MKADHDGSFDDVCLWVRDAVGAAGLEDAATENQVLQLADNGRGEDALKLLEAVARPVGTEEMFWRLMAETAAALGSDDRFAEYKRRYEEHLEHPPEWPVEEVVSTVRAARSVRDGFSTIVDRCAEHWPHQDWAQFRALELEPDVERLKRWLESLLAADPPRADAPVLWFGVCNPIGDDEPTSHLTVCGFAADPERAGPITWQPTGCEARSEALAQIYALACAQERSTGAGGASEEDEEDASFGSDAEYALCLTYAGLVVRTLADELAPELFLAQAAEREIFFGFDCGDAIRLGTITERGLRLHDR